MTLLRLGRFAIHCPAASSQILTRAVIMSRLCRLLLVAGLWLVGCSAPPTPEPTPTPGPTLNASLWVDYPILADGYKQAATVVVNDGSGKPVAGANVIGSYTTLEGEQPLIFPTTDDEGKSRVPLLITAPVKSSQVITLTVHIFEKDRWGKSNTSFQIVP